MIRALVLAIAGAVSYYYVIQRKKLQMKLSKNFRLYEFVRTSTGLFNYPDKRALENIQELVDKVLQPLRDRFGVIKVTSGYRSKQVNEAVGGVEDSEHRKGTAADIVPKEADINEVFRYLKTSDLPIKQAILETGKNGERWMHLVIGNGGEFLTAEWNNESKKMEYFQA